MSRGTDRRPVRKRTVKNGAIVKQKGHRKESKRYAGAAEARNENKSILQDLVETSTTQATSPPTESRELLHIPLIAVENTSHVEKRAEPNRSKVTPDEDKNVTNDESTDELREIAIKTGWCLNGCWYKFQKKNRRKYGQPCLTPTEEVVASLAKKYLLHEVDIREGPHGLGGKCRITACFGYYPEEKSQQKPEVVEWCTAHIDVHPDSLYEPKLQVLKIEWFRWTKYSTAKGKVANSVTHRYILSRHEQDQAREARSELGRKRGG